MSKTIEQKLSDGVRRKVVRDLKTLEDKPTRLRYLRDVQSVVRVLKNDIERFRGVMYE